jgi:hydroxyacylglutathione hydrolase
MDDRFYLRQLRAGRDFAASDGVAQQMANFVYLLGDRVAGSCVVVDPAWDVDGILAVAAADGMTVTGALVTHYHPDHVGGPLFGHTIQGLTRLLERNPCPIHVHKAEAHGVRVVTGVGSTDLVSHDSGDKVKVGEVEIELLHTPGHTPGSQCFRCGKAVISGDTLFLQGCGRVDLPGGDPDEMWRTLTERLATLPEETILYPGHDYGDRPNAPLQWVRKTNQYLKIPDLETWRRLMSR